MGLLSLCVNAPLASRNTVAAMSAYSDIESAVPEGYVAVPKKAVYAGALFVSSLMPHRHTGNPAGGVNRPYALDLLLHVCAHFPDLDHAVRATSRHQHPLS